MLDTERILIVDDDQAATREVAGFLERQGYPVLVARTGRDGLRTVRETPVSLVLLGLSSRDVDHARILREAGQGATPCEVLILADPGTLDLAIRAADGGAAGCIVKPVDLVRLGIIARRVLERRVVDVRTGAGSRSSPGWRLTFPSVVGRVNTNARAPALVPGPARQESESWHSRPPSFTSI